MIYKGSCHCGSITFEFTGPDVQSGKFHVDHKAAQRLGHEKWYVDFKVRVAKVERDYGA